MKRKNLKQDSPEKAVKSLKSETDISEHSSSVGDEKSFVAEVNQLLKDETTLLTGLSKLRDALRKKEGKGFNVFVEFVKDNSECPAIYKPLEKGRQNQAPLELQIAIEVLEQLLLLSADDSNYSAVGMYHVRRILQNHLQLLYSCLNPNCHGNMIKGALKLLVAMVAQGAFAAREVVAVFDFTLKAFGGLVHKQDIKSYDNIRICFIKFAMSFLMFGDDATIRHILDIKGFVSSIFKLILKDPPHVIAMVIKTLHEKVIKSTQVPKKSKVQLFNSYVLTQLSRLYKYSVNDDEEDDKNGENIREMSHELLQDVCCTFKYGICFANKLGMFAGRSNNPVLLRFLQCIPKNDHNAMLQQLIIKILMCCPDLVQPYLTSLKITYEPRLSLPWLANINFLIKIYSTLPLPTVMISKANFEFNKESLLQPALNAVFPVVLTRMNLNQGIQHSSLLVKNTTLSVIALVLNRAADLLDLCRKDASPSKMESFIQLFTDGLIKVLPDAKTVVSLRQNLMASLEAGKDYSLSEDSKFADGELSEQCQPSLLLSRVVQVLYGYQKVQPLILSSLAFDMGKLLPGQQDINNQDMFPPQVQYYTLKILLELPRGSFKWYHQKTKHGPSNMYSILKILVNTDKPEVKLAAEDLITKFLLDEGIVDKHSKEIEIWLKHLYNKTLKEHQEALVMFLDSILYSVAMEPYTYTDIVMEMTSQARQVNDRLSSQESKDERVAFSPLVVRALMSHVEMVSSSHDGYSVDQLGSIAQYINLVVLDFLRVMVNPLPLMLTIQRFYGDVALPKELSSLHNTHHSLVLYISCWTGTPNKVDEKQEEKKSTKILLKNFEKIKEPSSIDFIKLLHSLSKSQLCHSLPRLLHLCSSKLEEGVACLADHMTSTPYCLIGSTPISDDVLRLAKELPFPTLLWQMFGPLIININVTQTGESLRDSESNVVSREVLQHPGMQAVLIDSLKKENPSSFPTMCNHLLHYLSVFITASRDDGCVTDVTLGVTNRKDCVTSTANDLMTSLALLFQLLELMIDRLSHANTLSRSSCDIHEDELSENEEPCVTVSNDTMRDFCKAFLGHPVLYECFVSKAKEKGTMMSGLMSSLSKTIRSILDTNHVDPALIRPYVDVICDNAVVEITVALKDDGTVSNVQALQLLQVFSSYSDHQNLSRVITSLLELPLNMLVHHNKEPTQFLETLLTLLNAYQNQTPTANQDLPTDHMIITTNHLQSSGDRNGSLFCNHVSVRTNHVLSDLPTSNHVASSSRATNHMSCFGHMNERTNRSSPELSFSNFERLIEIAMGIASAKLDTIIHRLIKSSPKLLLTIKSSFLDFCLDDVTEEHITMATTLISSSVSLRKHFEQRCSKSNKTLFKGGRLVKLLPLVRCFLMYTINNEDNLQDNKALNFLVDKYCPYLWKWLLGSKKSDGSNEDIHCTVLELLIQLKATDVQDLKGKLTTLLNMVPDQIWDLHQISIVRTLLTSLKNDDNNEIAWNVLSACMENVSTTLSRDSGSSLSVEKTMETINDIINNHKEQLAKHVKDVDADVWASFVKNCLKYNFHCMSTFKCMTVCVKLLYTSLKAIKDLLPLTIMYEMVLTHSKFIEVIMDDSKESNANKEAVLDLVSCIAGLSPDCCQQSHLALFFSAYTASLSKTDQMILYLLHIYERAQISFSSYRPYLWGKAALDHHKVRKLQGPSLWQQPSTSEVLELLDESVMNHSALDFPIDRKLQPRFKTAVDPSCYDPCFMIPLFCHLLSPNTEVDCRRFAERGGLGYTVAALSSRDDHMRKAAGHVLSRYLAHLEAASFREKKQVLLLLVTFKNGIADVNTRVSSVITRFISRAAQVMLHPEYQMYFLLNSFLLQRASMDLREVPLFYTLFNSSSLRYRSERVWILDLLREGLRDAQDYYVFKKRHAMELAMGFHDSQLSDPQSRKLVIDLVRSALAIHIAAFDLAKNYGIVGWIHSLCLKGEEESTSTSLSLLHTLWFTIEHGKPGACDNDISGDEMTNKPIPPNLAQETLLVCKTFIRYLSKAKLEDVSLLFELLSSVLIYLGKHPPQGSQLTHDELLCLITTWSTLFNEQHVLLDLMNDVELTMEKQGTRNGEEENKERDEKYMDHKTKTLDQLLDVITLTKPAASNAGDSVQVTHLLACNFALEFAPLVDDITTWVRHQSVVTWLRRCLVTSPTLQKLILSPKGEQLIRHLIYLYISTNVSLMKELNMILLILISHVQHMSNDMLGSSANKVAELLPSAMYKEIMTSGLVEVLFPLYPSPVGDDSQGSDQVGVSVTELLSVFLQELWYGQAVPSHFLDTLVKSHSEISGKLVPIFLNGSAELRKQLQAKR